MLKLESTSNQAEQMHEDAAAVEEETKVLVAWLKLLIELGEPLVIVVEECQGRKFPSI